jgi:hypothetical protein
MKREVGSYEEDNAETARFVGDDVGLPESPIYSNFSKHLWKGHTRLGGVQKSDRFRGNADAQGPAQVAPPAALAPSPAGSGGDLARAPLKGALG